MVLVLAILAISTISATELPPPLLLETLSRKIVEQIYLTESQLPLLNWFGNSSSSSAFNPLLGQSFASLHGLDRPQQHFVSIIKGHFAQDGSLRLKKRAKLTAGTQVTGVIVWIRRPANCSMLRPPVSRRYSLGNRSNWNQSNEFLRLRIRHLPNESVPDLLKRLSRPVSSQYSRCLLMNRDAFIELRHLRPKTSQKPRRKRRSPPDEFVKTVRCEPNSNCCLMTAQIPMAGVKKYFRQQGEELRNAANDDLLPYSFCSGRCFRKTVRKYGVAESCCSPLAMNSIRLYHYKNNHGLVSLAYPISARSCGCV